MDQPEALHIPMGFYYLLGSLIVANLSTIGTIFVMALKASWYVSKLDSRVDNARDTAVRAHKRIDLLEGAGEGE